MPCSLRKFILTWPQQCTMTADNSHLIDPIDLSMKQSRTYRFNLFWILIVILYSAILGIGSIFPLGYAPLNYHLTFYDKVRLTTPFVHILLTWLSFVNWRFQKWLVFINLWFYLIIMSALLWMLQENDLNIFIVIYMIIWIVLVIKSFIKWRSLLKLDK